jgi:hypothetical protein
VGGGSLDARHFFLHLLLPSATTTQKLKTRKASTRADWLGNDNRWQMPMSSLVETLEVVGEQLTQTD